MDRGILLIDYARCSTHCRCLYRAEGLLGEQVMSDRADRLFLIDDRSA